MKVVYLSIKSRIRPIENGIVLALGYFDGLHKAHQHLINETIKIAKDKGVKSGVMTFHPSPKEVISKQKLKGYLTPHNKKISILSDLGVDYLFVIQFSEAMARLSHRDFIERFVCGLNTIHLVTGFDFRYGYKGRGNIHTLIEDGRESFGLSIIEELKLNGEKISASTIRQHIEAGRVDLVYPMLGRYYETEGIVIHGFKRGRELGYPTANIALIEDYVIPATGVYVVGVKVHQTYYYGMCNVGYNPTFNGNHHMTIEVHILDFNEDIYDEKITIYWYYKMREEIKFPNVEALIEQLKKDEKNTREWIKQL
ncbi:MAG TPA: bifunctional riboflavin kinase/FAD synthetase [Haloplasmataceae bacterium]